MQRREIKVFNEADENKPVLSVDTDVLNIEDELERVTRRKLDKALMEISELQKKLHAIHLDFGALRFTYKSFDDNDGSKENDEKVRFCTGLPKWEILSILYMYLKPHLSSTARNSLTPFQELLMALMRLRLNLSGQDLAYRFGVHKSTVSRIFTRVISVMYTCLRSLIYWPDRDDLQKTMPMDFRKYCPPPPPPPPVCSYNRLF